MKTEQKRPEATTTEQRARIYCGTCGVPWESHQETCPRHPYKPLQWDAHGRELPRDVLTMTRAELMELPEYSCSIPTGVFVGKRWRADANWNSGSTPLWLVGAYEEAPEKPDHCRIAWYRVEIKE